MHTLFPYPKWMLTQAIREQLLENGRKQLPVQGTSKEIDFFPVVKLFTPDAGAIWLLTEIDPGDEDYDIAFGLCDLVGLGFQNWALYVFLKLKRYVAVLAYRWIGICISRKPLSAYAADAKEAGRINA